MRHFSLNTVLTSENRLSFPVNVPSIKKIELPVATTTHATSPCHVPAPSTIAVEYWGRTQSGGGRGRVSQGEQGQIGEGVGRGAWTRKGSGMGDNPDRVFVSGSTTIEKPASVDKICSVYYDKPKGNKTSTNKWHVEAGAAFPPLLLTKSTIFSPSSSPSPPLPTPSDAQPAPSLQPPTPSPTAAPMRPALDPLRSPWPHPHPRQFYR